MNDITESQEIELTELVNIIQSLDSRSLNILSVKIASSDLTLKEIASDLYPELSDSTIRQLITSSAIGKIVSSIKINPVLTAQLLSTKLLPLAVLQLHKLVIKPDTRDNVKATAAKELIRYAESSVRTMNNKTIDIKSNLSNLLE